MGLLAQLSRLARSTRRQDRKSNHAELSTTRTCRFETMEPRKMLAADLLQIGAVFIEQDLGSDLHPDTFEVTFEGGAPNTQLTRIIIDGDQDSPGFGKGDVFFDTEPTGFGADNASPFQVVSLNTADPNASVVAHVVDGGTLLTIDFVGFHAGDKLIFSIDVDEVEDFDPNYTDLALLNEGFDPITSGVEFQGSMLTAEFSAPHFYPVSGTGEFRNLYDRLLVGRNLNLPADDEGGQRDRTDGVGFDLQQEPLPISIAGTVYLDHDLDLTQDPTDAGLGQVELSLWKRLGQDYVDTGHVTQTDALGDYEFGLNLNLTPGVYQVREVQPDGLFSVGAIPGTVAGVPSGSIVAANPDILTEIDMPLGGVAAVDYDFAEARPAEISGFVYHDRSNDGRRDPGEEGLDGVAIRVLPISTISAQAPVTITTDSNGFYLATGLAPGDYEVVELVQPLGYFDGLDSAGTVDNVTRGVATNPGDRLHGIRLLGGDSGIEYNFGEIAPASIEGRVHLSDREGDCFDVSIVHPPLAGVTVLLLDATGQQIAETRTDANGEYRFDELMPGEYGVVEITPAGLLDGDDHVGNVDGQLRGTITANDEITRIVLGAGEQGQRYDFCEHEPAGIAGFVYHDANNNGVFDPTEDPIENVQVELLDEANNVLGVRQTLADGSYAFRDLVAGDYWLRETQPDGWIDGLDTAGTMAGVTVGSANNPGDSIVTIKLEFGDHGVHYDFGELAPAKIGGFVFHDRNDNGIREPGEEGIEGVPIDIIPVSTMAAQQSVTIFTDQNGMYMTGMISPGRYRIIERTQPVGYLDGLDSPGTVNGQVRGVASNPGDQIEGVFLASGEKGIEYNFGEVLPASIRGRVHLSDSDQDCFNDSVIHQPVVGAEVLLQNDRGDVIARTTTDAQGEYAFEGLRPGTYTVVERTPAGLLDGGERAGTIDGTTVGEVSTNDTIRQILLLGGDDGVRYDFCEHEPAEVSGFVYHDRNDNGLHEAGEAPIAGVELVLLDASGASVGTTQTNDAGFYEFTGLRADNYSIVERHPDGWIDGRDEAGTVGGNPVGLAINPGDEIRNVRLKYGDQGINYNFGEFLPAAIRGQVHLSDSDEDCFDDSVVHQPVVGAEVLLMNERGDIISRTTTDDRGEYAFEGLRPGTYTVVERTPDGLLDGGERAGEVDGRTVGEVGPNDTIRQVRLEGGDQATRYDFCEHEPAEVSGFVYHDRNNNGLRELGEPPIADVQILLLDANDVQIDATVTNASGYYEFTGLRADDYTIVEQHPDGWFDGRDEAGTVDGNPVGFAINPGDEMHDVLLKYGDKGVDYNFGELLPASIAGIVHVDPNRNCLVDPGEAPIANVLVELLDRDGHVIASTQTGPDGRYQFDNLLPGRYTVRERQPDEYFHGGQRAGSAGGNDAIADLLTVDIRSGEQLVDYNFCELPPSSLSGYVFQDGAPIATRNGELPVDMRTLRDGQFTQDDTPIARVVIELRDGLIGDKILGSEALPGRYGSGPIRTMTDANGFYEFTGLPGGRSYAVYEVHPSAYADSIDTPGTTTGLAINPSDNVPQFFISRLSENPKNDAIILIPLGVGQNSQNNNFSEVVVTRDPPKNLPPEDPQFDINLRPVYTPALFTTPVVFGPPPAPVSAIPIYGGGTAYTWHLSVVDAGMPRGSESVDTVDVAVWRQATYLNTTLWRGEQLSDARWSIPTSETSDPENEEQWRSFIFGIHDAIPVTGDFNGDGLDEIGIYYQGEWFIDLNGNGQWDEDDMWAMLGDENDRPVTGDWDGDGKDDIGIFGPEWHSDSRAIRHEPGLPDVANIPKERPKNVPPKFDEATDGLRLIRLNEDGPRRADLIDHVFRFGAPRDIPVAVDLNGDGIASIGVFRDGKWKLDVNGDGRFLDGDRTALFGEEGDLPVVGDFNGDGVDEIGIYRAGLWQIDSNRNFELDAHDRVFQMGDETSLPVVGDWNGDGQDQPGLYQPTPKREAG